MQLNALSLHWVNLDMQDLKQIFETELIWAVFATEQFNERHQTKVSKGQGEWQNRSRRINLIAGNSDKTVWF